MSNVAIVGGGVTGLVAAFELKRRGVPFTLFEASDRVGGVIQTHRERGLFAKNHPPRIALSAKPALRRTINEKIDAYRVVCE